MSDEELAFLISNGCPPASVKPCRAYLSIDGDTNCADCWLDWLKQEADTATEYPEYLPQVECQPYQPKLPRNYKPDEDSMRRRGKLFSDMEQLGIKHNPDGSMEVAFKPQGGHND
jgi:hypothetical protein